MKKSRQSKKSLFQILLKLGISVTFLCVVFYLISMFLIHLFWLSVKDRLLESHENKIKISDRSFLTFENVNYEVSVSKIGIRILGLKQHNKKNAIVEFKDPLFIGFNPWNFSIFSAYKGSGDITQDNKNYNFDANVEYEVLTKLDFVIMKKILANPINIIHYFKAINLIFNKVSVKEGAKNILDVYNTKYTFIPKRMPEYKSLTEIIDNLPPAFILDAKLDIKKLNKAFSPPISFIHLFQYPESLSGHVILDIDSDYKSLSIKDILSKAKISIKMNDIKSDLVDFNSEIKIDNTQDTIKSYVSFMFVPHVGFEDRIISLILSSKKLEYFKNLIVYKEVLDTVKKQSPPIELMKKYRFKFNTSYVNKGNKITVDIHELNAFTENNVGFGLKGSCIMKDLNIKFTADALIFRAKDVVSYWVHYLIPPNKKIDIGIVPKINSFNEELYFKFLKNISDFPESNSKDLSLKINFKNGNLNLSGNDYASMIQKFITLKTSMVSKAVLEQEKPVEFILEVAPELEYLTKELFKKDSGKNQKTIGKSLWQRLIH
ncbi:MAG: hypothetical protein SFT68_03730 [Rickettsiaceae bacterium]|nr:hypothetical protein [Rickettsiaceae bacterium]